MKGGVQSSSFNTSGSNTQTKSRDTQKEIASVEVPYRDATAKPTCVTVQFIVTPRMEQGRGSQHEYTSLKAPKRTEKLINKDVGRGHRTEE
jgi:hypothetical protein